MHASKDDQGGRRGHGKLKGWIGLAVGVILVWVMAYVVLPWGQTLPHIRPVMEAIADSNVDTGTYWYSQCENTALAQMHIRNTLRNQ
ncbi:hypothetical protein [Desulfonatronum lacustre]|uniref:hypothetical protein n=1 Tax=Desulfonatronum lacustre TaxID=66849 RepID=UPI00048CAE99|nr:hypothetical protein [Desulfonatronum lacustre]SMP50055.1 hypothetical protein SAMN06295888_10644 [Desulfonatronum zhilinae]